jgi:hypothetical protein
MRHARQRQSQVCGVQGRASPGFGQQLHLWPLSNPEPGWMLISAGPRVFRRLTRCHRLGLVAGLRPAAHHADGHGPAGAAWRSSTVTLRREDLPGTGWCGRRPDAATASASETTVPCPHVGVGPGPHSSAYAVSWLAAGPRWTPPAAPPARRASACRPAPCAGARSRAAARCRVDRQAWLQDKGGGRLATPAQVGEELARPAQRGPGDPQEIPATEQRPRRLGAWPRSYRGRNADDDPVTRAVPLGAEGVGRGSLARQPEAPPDRSSARH